MATAQRTTATDSRFGSLALAGGTVFIAASLWLFGGGVTGLIVGFAIGFAAAASASYYGVALAHLAALLATPSPSLVGVALLELGSAAYLSTELAPGTTLRDSALLVVLTGIALAAVTGVATIYGSLAAATVLVAATAAIGYALYRYGLWKLGVLSEAPT